MDPVFARWSRGPMRPANHNSDHRAIKRRTTRPNDGVQASTAAPYRHEHALEHGPCLVTDLPASRGTCLAPRRGIQREDPVGLIGNAQAVNEARSSSRRDAVALRRDRPIQCRRSFTASDPAAAALTGHRRASRASPIGWPDVPARS